jgi:hypothetical protein
MIKNLPLATLTFCPKLQAEHCLHSTTIWQTDYFAEAAVMANLNFQIKHWFFAKFQKSSCPCIHPNVLAAVEKS